MERTQIEVQSFTTYPGVEGTHSNDEVEKREKDKTKVDNAKIADAPSR